VRIKVDIAGSAYAPARDAAFAIVSALESAIAADITLGGTVAYARVTSRRVEEAVEERTRSVGVILVVTASVSAG